MSLLNPANPVKDVVKGFVENALCALLNARVDHENLAVPDLRRADTVAARHSAELIALATLLRLKECESLGVGHLEFAFNFQRVLSIKQYSLHRDPLGSIFLIPTRHRKKQKRVPTILLAFLFFFIFY